MTATAEARRQPSSIKPGQRWTFVHSSGKETDYVVVDPEERDTPYEQTLRRMWARWEDEDPRNFVWLLNEDTGRFAVVTYYWLRRKPEPGVSHWLPPRLPGDDEVSF